MNVRFIFVASWTALCISCTNLTTQSTNEPQFFSSAATEALSLPLSDAVQVGDLLFLSGVVGNVPGTLRLVPGGIKAETRQTMDNISAVLKARNLDMAAVIKCTVFLADIAEWSAFNAVYAEYFSGPPPARSAFGANGLALGARVEVECAAYAG